MYERGILGSSVSASDGLPAAAGPHTRHQTLRSEHRRLRTTVWDTGLIWSRQVWFLIRRTNIQQPQQLQRIKSNKRFDLIDFRSLIMNLSSVTTLMNTRSKQLLYSTLSAGRNKINTIKGYRMSAGGETYHIKP